jgi:hypothetical protein
MNLLGVAVAHENKGGSSSMKAIQYRGTVRGFQAVLREIRKAAMRGDKLGDPVAVRRLQARLLALQAGERGWAA